MGDRKLYYRTPESLTRSPAFPRNVLLIGQCFLDTWPSYIAELETQVQFERVIFNHAAELSAEPPQPVESYDFQLISLPFRAVLPESAYMNADASDPAAYAELFAGAVDRMQLFLQQALAWNTRFGLTSLVCNFLVPQQSPMGRTFPRYDLRNIVYFVERLNAKLSETIDGYKHVYLIDADQVSASIGRRYIQDDAVNAFSHGSLIDNYGTSLDLSRLHPPEQVITDLYQVRTAQFVKELWLECCAVFRVIRNSETVKLVIVDLDDTLWRGVLAEEAEILPQEAIEGWPLGIADALYYLRARGIILSIASKNELSNVERVFDRILSQRLPLSRFAIKKINWLPKVENIQAIMEEANVGPSSVVFLDDNAVERDAVASAFPGIRTLGSDLYSIRRELLWSSETQVATITAESARRNEMIEAQVAREAARPSLSREDFLASLHLRLRLFYLDSSHDLQAARAFELLNKTNQFNTTGERWQRQDFDQAIDVSSRVLCFEVEDKFTAYGLVGVVLIRDNVISQAVMSCRVFGLSVETAVLSFVAGSILEAGHHEVIGRLIHTDRNMPCQEWFAANGFVAQGDEWRLGRDMALEKSPGHIRVDAPSHKEIEADVAA